MGVVRWLQPALGIFAIFDSNGTTGAVDDPNAPRNAPLINPAAHLDKIYMHSDLDLMEASHGPTNVSVSHAAVAAGTGPGGEVGMNGVMTYGVTFTDHVLLDHNLGYPPDFFAVESNDIVYPGRPVQTLADGRQRRIAVYATNTQIILREWAVRTANSIPALSRTYTVVVFRLPRPKSGKVMWWWEPISGILEAAFGKFRSDRRYLSVVPGGSPYGFSKGRTIDLANGAVRYVDPDGSIADTVPADFAMKVILVPEEPNTAPYGPSMAYNGSFTGAPAVLVQVP